MSTQYRRSLDLLIAAAVLASAGKHKQAAIKMVAATKQRDFKTAIKELSAANEEALDNDTYDDGYGVDKMQDDDKHVASAKRKAQASYKRRVMAADEIDAEDELGEEDADELRETEAHLKQSMAKLKRTLAKTTRLRIQAEAEEDEDEDEDFSEESAVDDEGEDGSLGDDVHDDFIKLSDSDSRSLARALASVGDDDEDEVIDEPEQSLSSRLQRAQANVAKLKRNRNR